MPSALILLFHEHKGERQIVNQWGEILAGNDVQNSTLGCKTFKGTDPRLRSAPGFQMTSEATVYLDFAQ